jgi:transcriptional antiterminator RfaH
MTRWYVARTHALGEEKALINLLKQGFKVYLPRYLKRRRHARRTEWVKAPLFPRYLFVNFDIAITRWRAISSTIGIDRMICTLDRPVPVPDGVIDDIKSRENERGLISLAQCLSLSCGDRIQIESGAFSDMTGLFECTTDDERIVVLLELLGRQVRVRVPASSLALAV